MWAALAVLFSTVMGIGSGASGLGQIPSQTGIPITSYATDSCYAPQPSVSITLSWPSNFTNVRDNRTTLNPALFGSLPQTFTSDETCSEQMMTDTNSQSITSRKYILVRQNVRIPSCKVDELAGPYTANAASCPGESVNGAQANRGSCNVEQYPDLRKVADVQDGGETLEIFWNPYTHNVGCDFDPNKPNCGTDGNVVANMRSFIYVLRSREAFDIGAPSDCQVLWDAGARNKAACSHYFDVYMAEDVYQKSLNPSLPETDPDFMTYRFIRGVIANCQQEKSFTPIVDVPGISIPPQFINLPFAAESEITTANPEKIIPQSEAEKAHYQYYIHNSQVIKPDLTHLLRASQASNADAIEVCPQVPYTTVATPTPNPDNPDAVNLNNCFLPIGNISFLDSSSTRKIFAAYVKHGSPQTFHLSDPTGYDTSLYTYTITEESPLQNTSHSPSLQLTALQFSSGNEWTWATPVCKPALYFYPEKQTELNVKLNLAGSLTVSDPPYTEDGWTITAHPNGNLFPDPYTLTPIPYLYYEADITGVSIPKEGWVSERSNIKYQISNILETIGFNEKEINDFNEYWLPRLTEKPYYFITLLPEEEINSKEKLIISKPFDSAQGKLTTIIPDTLIRARVIFEGLDSSATVSPLPHVPQYARKGFTVTDWGGTLIGKSCEDITVR